MAILLSPSLLSSSALLLLCVFTLATHIPENNAIDTSSRLDQARSMIHGQRPKCTGCDDWCTADCPGSCVGVANTHPIYTEPPEKIIDVQQGSKYMAGPPDLVPRIAIVHVWGTPMEMGVAQGKLLKEEISALIPQVMAYLKLAIPSQAIPPEFQDAYAKNGIEGCLDQVFNMTKPFMPQHFIDEFTGIAMGSGLPVQHIQRLSMMGELTKMGCSMIGAWGPASKTQGLVQLRALDWDTDGPFQAYPTILVRHPSAGGGSFASVGYAGLVGAITGYSEAGVGLSEKVWLHDKGPSSWSGEPTTFVLQDVLQFATNLSSAIQIVSKATRTNSIFVGVGAKTDGEFRMMEYSHSAVEVWDDTNGPNYGNHTQRPGLLYLDKHTQPDAGQGAWCLDGLMKEKYGQLDAVTLMTEIAPIYQTGDSQVAAYDFDAKQMYVTFPSVSGFPGPPQNVTKAYDRPITRLDMDAIFAVQKPQK